MRNRKARSASAFDPATERVIADDEDHQKLREGDRMRRGPEEAQYWTGSATKDVVDKKAVGNKKDE
jgi:hypothetical protein